MELSMASMLKRLQLTKKKVEGFLPWMMAALIMIAWIAIFDIWIVLIFHRFSRIDEHQMKRRSIPFKMIPLKRSYQLFTLLCICPPDPLENRWIKYRNITVFIFAFICQVLGNISSFFFIAKYLKTDLRNSFYACLQCCGYTTVILTTIAAYIQRDQIKDMFSNIRTFYDSCKEFF